MVISNFLLLQLIFGGFYSCSNDQWTAWPFRTLTSCCSKSHLSRPGPLATVRTQASPLLVPPPTSLTQMSYSLTAYFLPSHRTPQHGLQHRMFSGPSSQISSHCFCHSLHSSHTGLQSAPQASQALFCLRAFAHTVLCISNACPPHSSSGNVCLSHRSPFIPL